MSIIPQKSKKQQTADVRRRRRSLHRKPARQISLWRQLQGLGLLVVMLAAVTLICFVGQSPAGPRLMPGQTARVRVTAQVPFSYTSEVLTRQAVEERQQQVRPAYRIEMGPFGDFAQQIDALVVALNERLQPDLQELPIEDWEPLVEDFVQQWSLEKGTLFNTEDILALMRLTSPEQRRSLFEEALLDLKDILSDGVYPVDDLFDSEATAGAPMVLVEVIGRRGSVRLESEADAASTLRMNLTGLGDDLVVSRALFRIMRRGLEPNLVFDRERYEQKLTQVSQNIPPVTVQVGLGEVLVESGDAITAQQLESLEAYRDALLQRDEAVSGFNTTLAKRVLLAAMLLTGAGLAWAVLFAGLVSWRDLLMCCLVVLAQLLVLRLWQVITDWGFVTNDPSLVAAAPYAAPLVAGAMVLCLLTRQGPAALAALVVCVLYAIMRGNSLNLALISLLGALVAIFFTQGLRLRGRIVRAGIWSGLTVAVAAALHGVTTDVAPEIIGYQALAGLLAGLLSGTFAVAALPFVENLFQRPSDITLLELTDFNHPLLRQLQLQAPGSYHHSLMVANLSERAASKIGANTTFCRAACLFHDIGKMVKPEYFVENQRSGENPHDDISPSMSALIIKNHVKEGVQLAREARLPKVIVEIIEQHHGTTLIRFFHHKAQQRLAEQSEDSSPETLEVDEAAFRYEGPRPRSRESAIIFIADAVEAASRSLKKVTPQSVEELIDSIIAQRLNDRQLDEAPLTMNELRIIRESLCSSVLDMLHSRVEYPKAKTEKKAPRDKPDTRSPLEAAAQQTQPPIALAPDVKS